jgi:hypothetical protein
MLDNKPSVCIVGSGPGGAIAAIELARSGLFRVIVVDLDKITDISEDSRNISKLLSAINTGYPFGQEITRGFGFGGGSQLWHGVLTKLDDQDWSLLDSRVNKPLSEEVKIYYDKLEKYFGNLPYTRAQKLKQKLSEQGLLGELEGSGKFVGKDFFLQKKPLRLRQHLLKARDQGLPIEFIENAVALSIKSVKGAKDTISSILIDVKGDKLAVTADYFILSAGACETPRIVLQSMHEKAISLKNVNIGKYLIDHPWTVLGEIISKNGNFRLGLTDIFLSGKIKYRVGYRLYNNESSLKIGENHCVAIKPLFLGKYLEFKDTLKDIIFQRISLKNILLAIWRHGIPNILASTFLLLNEKLGFGAYVKRALVFCYLEQPERRDSCVTLSNIKASNGRMIPKINWIVDEEETTAVNSMTNHINSVFNDSKNFSFLPSKTSVRELSSGSHHAGTMRIGSNELNGVIDSNLQVFGTSNLFVCDLSIFPNYGNSNPTFTLAAFSVRLADYLILRQKNACFHDAKN